MTLLKKTLAEALGTAWLVFGGCGAAVISAKFPQIGIGGLGVAFAFGLSVLTMVYAVGPVSGGHFNPAVSFGMWVARKLPSKDLLPYVLSQVAGGLLGAGALYVIASGGPTFSVASGFASNGYGAHSPGLYTAGACFFAEFLLTAMFLAVILGVTHSPSTKRVAPVAIGLALTLIHLIAIPVTNTSVNPARSTGPALFADPWALQQLWMFWVAPLLGALVAGGLYALFTASERKASKRAPALKRASSPSG